MLKSRLVLLLILLFVIGYNVPEAAQRQGVIYPAPKKIEYKGGFLNIDSTWKIVSCNRKFDRIAQNLSNEINERLDVSISVDYDLTNIKKAIVICDKVDIAGDLFASGSLPSAYMTKEEAYIIKSTKETVYIISNNSRGAFYGSISLLSLFKVQNSLLICPLIEIVDYPSCDIRAVHFCGADPKSIKKQLKEIAELKYNTAIIDTWDYFHLSESNNADKWREIFDYARSLNINPIPELQSFGAAGSILTINPQSAEGIWVKDAEFKFYNDIAKPVNNLKLPLKNILRNKETDIIITSIDGKTVYEEDRDYEIINGITAYPFEKTNKSYIIKRIKSGRLKNSQNILVSYDYVERKCDFANWSIPYCPSSEITYKIMDTAIDNVIAHLQPSQISIGHDEVRGLNRDSRCLKRDMTNAELLSEDINKLYDIINKYDNSIEILMWADMLNPWHNGGKEDYQVQFGGKPGKTDIAADYIPNDIILLLWWLNKDNIKYAPAFFSHKGYHYWAEGNKWLKAEPKPKGILITTWDGFNKAGKKLNAMAEILW
jgi:hypothetical protein